MSRHCNPLIPLFLVLFALLLPEIASAADLWPEVLERLQQQYQPVMPDIEANPGKAPIPRGRMVTRDLETGELIERDDVSLESLLGRQFTDGGKGLLEELFDPEGGVSNKNFNAWTQVGDPSSNNFQKRVKLWMNFTDINGNMVSSQCSGTLLDPYHVLTAAHCIFSWSSQGQMIVDWADSITVAAGFSGSNFPLGTAQAANLTSWTGWTQNNDQDHDVGVITLDRPIGLLTGWYGYGFNEDCDYFENGSWHMAGYPAEAPFDGTLMYEAAGNYDDCPVTGWDDQIRWYMPSSGGLSGSGAQRDGTIWAVLSTSNRTTRSSVCRLTEGKFDDVGSLLNQETLGSPDVLPMTVQAPAAVTQGDQLGSVSFIMGNTASVSASGTWDYKMYLSTDAAITSSDILIDTGSYSQSLPPRGAAWVSLPTPTISPISVPAGNYSIGIIITNNDANFSNNDSSGQEAASITVLCPSQAGVPALQTPASGATCVPTESIWMQWASVGSYAQYEIQVGTSPGTGDVYSTPQTNYVLSGLNLSTTYYWRLRARRGCGPWSAWSGSRAFTTEIDEYTYSQLVAPLEGEHCQAANGTMLQWSALPQAQYYEIQISDNWCYEGTIYQPVGTQLYLSNLTPNTTYYWRVRAFTSCGSYTNWSSVPGFCWTFKTAATTAAPPIPNIPLNGSACEPAATTIQWNHTEDWDSYEVQVGTSCGTGAISQTSANSLQLQGLLNDTVYHWRLRVTQECGLTSAWSACSTFTVDDVPPTNPTTISSNSHTVASWSGDNTVDVWWDYGTDLCNSWVEYGTLWDQSPLTVPDVFNGPWEPEFSFETSPPLSDGIHWFHLRSIDLAQNWAVDAMHFGPIWIDANPPTTPVVTTDLPVGEWINAPSVAASWNASDAGSGLDHYLVAFDQSSSTIPVASTGAGGINWSINNDGPWYVHVMAVDAISQQSVVTHHGPILIDNSVPVVAAQFPDAANVPMAGESFEITFSLSNKAPEESPDAGELKLSTDGGQSFEDVVELDQGHFRGGRIDWQVPPYSTGQAILRLCVRDRAGNEGMDESDPFAIGGVVGVGDAVPGQMALVGNYPNPFNPRTTIEYSLARRTEIRLDIFDTRGRLVRSLVNGEQPAGPQRAIWNGNDAAGRSVPSGVYYYRLRADELDETRRMVLVK